MWYGREGGGGGRGRATKANRGAFMEWWLLFCLYTGNDSVPRLTSERLFQGAVRLSKELLDGRHFVDRHLPGLGMLGTATRGTHLERAGPEDDARDVLYLGCKVPDLSHLVAIDIEEQRMRVKVAEEANGVALAKLAASASLQHSNNSLADWC